MDDAEDVEGLAEHICCAQKLAVGIEAEDCNRLARCRGAAVAAAAGNRGRRSTAEGNNGPQRCPTDV